MPRANSFPASHRIRRRSEFARAFQTRMRQSRGPITIYAAPNGLNHARLGLSVPRAVGTAVRRNRIKRLLREAFRLHQRELPAGYDLVVSVRPHQPMSLEDYAGIVTSLAARLHGVWQGRSGAS